MRKLISSLLVAIIIISSFSISFANQSMDKISLKENGIGRNFQVVNIKVDGKAVKSADVPPVIYPLNNQGRTLVPLRMIIDHFGDKLNADIEWDGTNNQVKIITKDKEILLKIDSAVATVNGVAKNLPDNLPAKLLAIGSNGRTMVPIRFFAEELGLTVKWDDKTWTASIDIPEQTGGKNPEEKPEEKPPVIGTVSVTDIKVETNGAIPKIRIKTSGKVSYKELKLVNPDRLVIDFENTIFDIGDRTALEPNGTLHIPTNNDLIKNVRMSQFNNNPFITRIVMELGKTTAYQVTYDEQKGEIIIDFPNYIRSIKREVMNAKEVIVIDGDYLEDYSIMKLNNPDRAVIDITGGILHDAFKSKTMNVDGRAAKTVRVSQHNVGNDLTGEKTVRIVVDLQDNLDTEEIYAEVVNNRLYLHLEGEPLKAVKYEETGWTTSKLTFLGSRVTRYSIQRQQGNLIEMSVPKADIELDAMNLQIGDHIVKSMDISENREGSEYHIRLELQDSVEYQLLSSEKTQDFVLNLNNKAAKYREKLIVIDPGHGGSDPGTISPISGAYESIVVLDIALRLNQLLTEAGFRTYMTRVDNLSPNIKLELQERVDVAEQLKADLFVSVHANSALASSASGLENYYHSTDPRGKKLAEIFQSEMVKNANVNNRGAKVADFFVLRNTTMPSVLTETGFLSNPGDEAKLASSQHRQQLAEGMFKGILRYFEENK